jgi:GNAT superfamily N-acetyltransferase
MTIEIRKAEASDFAEVYRMIRDFAVFIQKPEYVEITAEQLVADKEHFHCLIALDGEKAIGFATYFFAYYSWTGKSIYLDDLYVEEPYRGMGIGNRLFEEVYALGKREQCKKMKWQVSKWNDKAIEFYKLRGTRIDDVEINCNLPIS